MRLLFALLQRFVNANPKVTGFRVGYLGESLDNIVLQVSILDRGKVVYYSKTFSQSIIEDSKANLVNLIAVDLSMIGQGDQNE